MKGIVKLVPASLLIANMNIIYEGKQRQIKQTKTGNLTIVIPKEERRNKLPLIMQIGCSVKAHELFIYAIKSSHRGYYTVEIIPSQWNLAKKYLNQEVEFDVDNPFDQTVKIVLPPINELAVDENENFLVLQHPPCECGKELCSPGCHKPYEKENLIATITLFELEQSGYTLVPREEYKRLINNKKSKK